MLETRTANSRHVRGFSWAIVVVLTISTLVSFAWLGLRIVHLTESGALEQARSYTDLIIAARAWNSDAGGVYLRTSETIAENPYLRELGVEPNLEAADGSMLTLRNPAAMTREIGDQLPLADDGSDFKLTSLEYVNPDNAPDAWEEEGLRRFDAGSGEHWAVVGDAGARTFRYMRPLVVDGSCLACHGDSGYQVGDIRGAISIRLPYERVARTLDQTRVQLIALAGAIIAILWLVVWGSARWLRSRLAESSRRLELAANTDALTGLWNRGYALSRLAQELERASRSEQAVGVALLDIDRFKAVNDRYGHAAGDEVLVRTAEIMVATVRSYDVVARIGGEEFLVIAPDIESDALHALAERVRVAIEGQPAAGGGTPITASLGTAYACPGSDESTDALVARADGALYEAKESGRNRVVSAE